MGYTKKRKWFVRIAAGPRAGSSEMREETKESEYGEQANSRRVLHEQIKEMKLACKPGSVRHPFPSAPTVIPLGPRLPVGSSNLPGGSASHAIAPLFGLAPDGVYPAAPVARDAVSSYLAISPLPDPLARPSAVYFLWHFP